MTPPPEPRCAGSERLLHAACRLLAFALPALLGGMRAPLAPHWADDLGVVRVLGREPLGFEGYVSTALFALADAVPAGTPVERAAWLGSAATGVAALSLYALGRRLLRARGASPVSACLTALVGTLALTLGTAFQLAAVAPGGAALGAALALVALGLVLGAEASSGKAAFALGALSFATAVESRWTGLALLTTLVVAFLTRRVLPEPRRVALFAAGALLPVAYPALCIARRAAAAPGGLREALLPLGVEGRSFFESGTALATWMSDAGILVLGLSLGGFALGAFDRRSRAVVLPLLALALLDVACGAPPRELALADPRTGVRLLALAALALSFMVGFDGLLRALSGVRVPLAHSARAMLAVYGLALSFVAVERSSAAFATRSESRAALWTERVLDSVPPKSALLVRSAAAYLRLRAAELTGEARSDVLLVPTAFVHEPSVQRELLALEPAAFSVLRDLLLTGRPTEHSLSTLADARPTFVELDPSWDPRLYKHLVPRAFLSEFSPHPLGRSDRRIEAEISGRAPVQPGDAQGWGLERDPATRAMLLAAMTERALLLGALGDRDAAQRATDELLTLDPNAVVGRRLKARLAEPESGRIDVRELLAAR
ncbi:MAG TPA: hypothetical protein VKY73_09440 [Polyangiaceae bacterium]|nr:hypothetical protein [Polyangiaceae bacterium]